MKLIVESNRHVDINSVDINKTTALHIAAREGHHLIADYLLSCGARVTLKDYKNRNPLEMAIEKEKKYVELTELLAMPCFNSASRNVVLSILKSTQWMEAMRSCRAIAGETFTGKSTLNTPMRMLVKKFPDIAEFVLDKCYKEVKRDSEICIEMNFEFVEDTFNYKKIVEGTKHSMVMNPFRNQNIAFQHFTSSNMTEERNEGFEQPYTNDYEMILRNHPMIIMAENSRAELMRHPLCLALVRKKWKRYGKYTFYFVNLLPYLLYLASITLFVLTSPNPISHPQFYDCSNYFTFRPILKEQINTQETINNHAHAHLMNNTSNEIPEDDFGNQTYKILIWILTALFVLRDVLQDKHMVFINAVVYLDVPWSFILDYVLYVLVIYVTAGSEIGYNIPGSGIHTDNLRTVRFIQYWDFRSGL